MPAPRLYEEFRDVIRIHLKQILKLDEHTQKVPMHTVALLVMVGYEALARYTRAPETSAKDVEWLFALRHEQLYNIPAEIGRIIFKAIRNGLAHVYGQIRVPVEGLGEIRFILTWKDGAEAHFRGVTRTVVNGVRMLTPFPAGSQEIPRLVCVNVGSLWADLDQLFTETTATLGLEAAGARFEALAEENRIRFTKRLPPRDPDQWRAFLVARRIERGGAAGAESPTGQQ